MRKTSRDWRWLLGAFITASLLGWYGNTFTPDSVIYISLFIGLIGITAFCIGMVIFANLRRALLLATGLMMLLTLRVLGLTSVLYIVLLVISLISLELAHNKR